MRSRQGLETLNVLAGVDIVAAGVGLFSREGIVGLSWQVVWVLRMFFC
jgi:hypothetical protein